MTTPTDIERLKALTIAIQSYQQADEEGVMVLVSRQACDETAAALRALPSLLARIERGEGEPSAISLLERARDELVECAQDYHHQPKAMIAEINAYLAAAEQSLSSARAEGWKTGVEAAAKVARERVAVLEAFARYAAERFAQIECATLNMMITSPEALSDYRVALASEGALRARHALDEGRAPSVPGAALDQT